MYKVAATNLTAGTYSCTVTDANGCQETQNGIVILQFNELLTQAVMTQPIQCFGFNNGSAFASATGGTGPYSFVWDSINGITGQYTDSILTPGVHTIYVTDVWLTFDDGPEKEVSDWILQTLSVDTFFIQEHCDSSFGRHKCIYGYLFKKS